MSGILILKLWLFGEREGRNDLKNTYYQYCSIVRKFSCETPFDPPLMVYFCKRLTRDDLTGRNEEILTAEKRTTNLTLEVKLDNKQEANDSNKNPDDVLQSQEFCNKRQNPRRSKQLIRREF
jgi:hypothetical protein